MPHVGLGVFSETIGSHVRGLSDTEEASPPRGPSSDADTSAFVRGGTSPDTVFGADSECHLQAPAADLAASADLFGLGCLFRRVAALTDRKEQFGVLVRASGEAGPIAAIAKTGHLELLGGHRSCS